MNEDPSKKNPLEEERKERQKTLELLNTLEGFQKLSPKQQQIIRVSLYLEDRTHRTEGRKKCLKSLEVKRRWNCHLSALLLKYPDNKKILKDGELPEEIIEEINKTEYIESENPKKENIIRKINETGLPCIVVISKKEFDYGTRQNRFSPVHSCVALGKDDSGNIILWQKLGFNGPFKISVLDRAGEDDRFKGVYQTYSKRTESGEYYWGTILINIESGETNTTALNH